MAVATRMTVDELALALALHAKLHGLDARPVRGQLDVTPRAHFDEARLWADSNAKTVALVGADPLAVAAGSYSLNEARGWLSRLLGLGKARGPAAPVDEDLAALETLAAQERTVDPEKARRLAAIRELVDDSFDTA